MTGLNTNTLSPTTSSGSMESLGILKEANTNTCKTNHKTPPMHSQKTIFIALSKILDIHTRFFISSRPTFSDSLCQAPTL
jgi:hypothetical protein